MRPMEFTLLLGMTFLSISMVGVFETTDYPPSSILVGMGTWVIAHTTLFVTWVFLNFTCIKGD
jgi:hypothetical protein